MKKHSTTNNNQSFDEKIAEMKLVFTNAKKTEFLSHFQSIGYTQEKLDQYLEQVTQLEALALKQKKEYAEQYAETEKVNNKREEIDTLYKRHLAFCKILFKDDVLAITSLGLNTGRKRAYGSWFQQVSGFYAQLLANPTFMEKVNGINIKQADIEAQQTALAELTQTKAQQKKETAQAQKATESRDNAFDAINDIYLELKNYSKILFQDDQLLEALGIVVKR